MDRARLLSRTALLAGLGFFSLGPLGPCACQNPLGPDPGPGSPAPAFKVLYDPDQGAPLCGGCTWVAPASGVQVSSYAEGAAYAHSGAKGMRVDLSWPEGWYGGWGYNFGGWSNLSKAVDSRPYSHLELWIRGALGGEQGFSVAFSDTSGGATGSLLVLPKYLRVLTTDWQRLRVPLQDMPWGTCDRSKIWEIDLSAGYALAGRCTVDIDEVRFVSLP